MLDPLILEVLRDPATAFVGSHGNEVDYQRRGMRYTFTKQQIQDAHELFLQNLLKAPWLVRSDLYAQ